MDSKKVECSLRTEVAEGDTQKLSRGVGWEEREEGEDSWAGLSSACSLTDSTWLTGMPGPSGRNGVLGWRVLGVMQATHDLQWKGSCHSWNTQINKVLAQSRYLPSSSNKYPCTGYDCISPSNCHKYIHWNYGIWNLACICGNIVEISVNSHTHTQKNKKTGQKYKVSIVIPQDSALVWHNPQ